MSAEAIEISLPPIRESDITDSFRYSNYVEGFVWIAVGLLALKAARDRQRPRHGVVLLLTFIVFGFSDWVESTTGAWWRPWWLFAWKAICVIGVLVISLHTRFAKRPVAVSQPTSR